MTNSAPSATTTSTPTSKVCKRCGNPLLGRRSKWCSDECSEIESRRVRLLTTFAITPEEYEAILHEQAGGCAICGKPPRDGKRLAVDHDHQTGFVRGLLCFFCNKRVLGARSADVLIRTAAYVTDPPARRVIGDRVAPGRAPKKRRPRRRPTTRRK